MDELQEERNSGLKVDSLFQDKPKQEDDIDFAKLFGYNDNSPRDREILQPYYQNYS
jgi:hypothetical protein